MDHQVEGKTLLDIGGGIGMIPAELFKEGLQAADLVEASQAFINAAGQLMASRNLQGRIRVYPGDFVDIHDSLDNADIVTLDKVICCYKDYVNLVNHSVRKAGYLYGIVIPAEDWWVKLAHGIGTVLSRWSRSSFRSYVHPIKSIERIIIGHGFSRSSWCRQREWVIAVYVRKASGRP